MPERPHVPAHWTRPNQKPVTQPTRTQKSQMQCIPSLSCHQLQLYRMSLVDKTHCPVMSVVTKTVQWHCLQMGSTKATLSPGPLQPGRKLCQCVFLLCVLTAPQILTGVHINRIRRATWREGWCKLRSIPYAVSVWAWENGRPWPLMMMMMMTSPRPLWPGRKSCQCVFLLCVLTTPQILTSMHINRIGRATWREGWCKPRSIPYAVPV